MKKTLSIAIAALCLSATAQAHQVWIEQPAGKPAIVRFGEFAENLREASPGYLDTFVKLSARLVSPKGELPLKIIKVADGFTLSAKAERNESLLAEEQALPLRKFKHGGGEPINAWFLMNARYTADASVAAQPKLTMDIVPTGKPAEFQLVLKGQPLAKAKLVAMVQSGWEKVAYTDAQGKARFDLPWKGQYVLRAMHIDRTPGERQGANGPEAYDGIGYVSTLTFVKPDGAAPLPAGPALPPNKLPPATPAAAPAK